MTEKKLTPQERAQKFAEEYQKLVAKFNCQLVAIASITPEGRIIAQNQVQVNDEG